MARVAIVTDSTSDLSPELRERYGITTVPLNVHFGSDVLRDQVDISSDEFMRRLQSSSTLPTTSQPSAGLFEETFRRLASDYDEIVCPVISSKLSGTMQSALIARDAVANEIPVEVVDSLSATMALGLQALHAAELAQTGQDAKTIADHLRTESDRFHVVFFVDTLEYLRRGGRIGKAASLLGSVLQLKPLLRVDEGQIVPFERTRTRAKALTALVNFATSLPSIDRLCVLHSTTAEDAQALSARVGHLAAREGDWLAQFSPVIGTHVGPGAVGLAIFEGDTT